MSRILKRPMFRKGGEVMEGIMTGIKPRQNYSLAGRVDEYTNVLRAATRGTGSGRGDPLTRFLLETGQNLIGGESAGGTKLQEIIGATRKPSQNLFAALDKRDAMDKKIGLEGAILGIKGQQAIEAAKAKGKFQKEFSPDRQEFELIKEFTKDSKGVFRKDIKKIFPRQMAKFIAKDSKNLDTIEVFKGKNKQIFPHSVSGTKVSFAFDEMLPGTLYFRPDQENSMFERDPEKNVIIQYSIFTGEKIKEIPLGG